MSDAKKAGGRQKWIWTVLIVCWTGFIYRNSLASGDMSSGQSKWVLMIICRVLDSLEIDSSWLTEYMIRKTAHFAEYAVLGLLLWNGLRSWRMPPRLTAVVQAWLGMLVPLTDETLQLFTDGRSGQISDVWLDIAGVFFGTLLTVALGRLWGWVRRRRQAGG